MVAIAASQLPRVRDDLVRYCGSGVIERLIPMHAASGGNTDLPLPEARMPIVAAMAPYQQRLVNLAGLASLFHVSAEMTDLAVAASTTMPGYRLHRNDLPAPRGLIVFDTPISSFDPAAPNLSEWDRRNVEMSRRAGQPLPPASVIGALWGPARRHDGREGVLVVLWADASELDEYHDKRGVKDLARRRSMSALAGPLTYHDETVLPFGDRFDERRGADEQKVGNEALGALLCTWLLMGHQIVSVDPAPMPRQTRRRFEREGKRVPRVRVVKLRQSHHPPPTRSEDGADEGSTRAYRHQWFVRGHWRRQWYPSVADHRPVYITPHRKGPEGAPILGPEKVYDWTR